MRALLFPIVLLFLIAPLTAAVVTWTAASGLLPSETDPAWELSNFANPEVPVLTSSALVISTDDSNELMAYQQRDAALTIPPMLVIESEMRFISGSSAESNYTSATIGFSTAVGSIGNFLFIGQDEIFLLDPGKVRGASAVVDTDDAFHTYRIEVDGVLAGSPINVYQDDILVLSGALVPDATSGNVGPRILFGDAFHVEGVSEWKRLSHNAATVPESKTIMLAVAGMLGVLRRRRSR